MKKKTQKNISVRQWAKVLGGPSYVSTVLKIDSNVIKKITFLIFVPIPNLYSNRENGETHRTPVLR